MDHSNGKLSWLLWGPGGPINLLRSSIGWLAVYYDNCHATPEIIHVFKPKNLADYYAMRNKVAWYNYHTDRLCPIVKALTDGPVEIGDINSYLELVQNSKNVRRRFDAEHSYTP